MKNISKTNLGMDMILLTVFLLTAVSGLILWRGFPPGSGGPDSNFWGLARHDWKNVHVYSAIILLAQAVLHLALHWTWIAAVARRLFGRTSAQARRNFAIDTLLFILFALTVVSGLVLWLVPGGPRAITRMESAFFSGRVWKEIHEIGSLILIALAALHFTLHVRWIKAQVRSLFRRRTCSLKPVKPLQRM